MNRTSPARSIPDFQFFHDVFDASPIGIAVENLEGQPLFVNPSICSFLGFSKEELRDKHCIDFSPTEDAAKDWALFQQLRAGAIEQYQLEKRYLRQDGSLVWGNLSISLLGSRPSSLVLAMVEDITAKKKAEDARLRHVAIIESSEDAIISKDLGGIVTGWNSAAQQIFGYTKAEAIGQSISMIIPPDLRHEESNILERLKAGERIEHYETIRITKAGEELDVSLSISPIKDSTGKVVGASKIARDITERKLAEQAIADINRKLVAIQEEERTRIARDLHDDINQRLALLAIEVDSLTANPPRSSADLSRQLRLFKERIAEISMGVQSISHQLHPPQLEYLGVVAAIRSFCREFSQRHAVAVDFKIDDISQPISHEISLCLFRILQEALHNAARHSKVRRFEVRLACSASHLHLTVSDRGTGFDAETAMNKGGLGLISMRERVRLVNGTIAIDSKPKGGTIIHVRVPFGIVKSSEGQAVKQPHAGRSGGQLRSHNFR